MVNQTSEIRAQKWAEIVVACNRSGQATTAGRGEQGVNRKSGYYWQSKLRKHAAGWALTASSIVPLQIAESRKGETANHGLPSFAKKVIRILIKGPERR